MTTDALHQIEAAASTRVLPVTDHRVLEEDVENQFLSALSTDVYPLSAAAAIAAVVPALTSQAKQLFPLRPLSNRPEPDILLVDDKHCVQAIIELKYDAGFNVPKLPLGCSHNTCKAAASSCGLAHANATATGRRCQLCWYTCKSRGHAGAGWGHGLKIGLNVHRVLVATNAVSRLAGMPEAPEWTARSYRDIASALDSAASSLSSVNNGEPFHELTNLAAFCRADRLVPDLQTSTASPELLRHLELLHAPTRGARLHPDPVGVIAAHAVAATAQTVVKNMSSGALNAPGWHQGADGWWQHGTDLYVGVDVGEARGRKDAVYPRGHHPCGIVLAQHQSAWTRLEGARKSGVARLQEAFTPSPTLYHRLDLTGSLTEWQVAYFNPVRQRAPLGPQIEQTFEALLKVL